MPIAREDSKIQRKSSEIKRTDCCPCAEDEFPDTDPIGDPVPPPRPLAFDCCRCDLGPAEPCEEYAHNASQCQIQGATSNPDTACVGFGGLTGKVTGGSPNHGYACDMAPHEDRATVCSCGGGHYVVNDAGIEVSYYVAGDCTGAVDHTEEEIEVTWGVSVFFGDIVVQVLASAGGMGAWYGESSTPGGNCKGPHIVPYVNTSDPAPDTGNWFIDGSARVSMCEPLDATESTPGAGDGCVDLGDDFAMGFGGMLE